MKDYIIYFSDGTDTTGKAINKTDQKQKRTTFRRYNMDLHFDKETGKVNEDVEKGLACLYREAIEKIVNYLSELFKYNRISTEEIPSDVCDKAHERIEEVRGHFIDDTLMYSLKQGYITTSDCKSIFKSFYESIAQLEDIYLYKSIYRKSKFHLEYGVDYEKYKIMNE